MQIIPSESKKNVGLNSPYPYLTVEYDGIDLSYHLSSQFFASHFSIVSKNSKGSVVLRPIT